MNKAKEKPTYEELEVELEEARQLINAIRNGHVDTILGHNQNTQFLRLENLKLVDERDRLLRELQDAMENIKILRGLIPMCASCKNIRDDKGFWNQVETYIEKNSEAVFSHGICPDCIKKLYPDVNLQDMKK